MKKHLGKIIIIFTAVAVIITGYILYSLYTGEFDFYESWRVHESFDDGWKLVSGPGEKDYVTLPATVSDSNGMIAIERVLPIIDNDTTQLSIYSLNQDVAIFIDGKVRHTYIDSVQGNEDISHLERREGRPSSSAYVFAELSKEDSFKTVRIELYSNAAFNNTVSRIYIGKRGGIWGFYQGRAMLGFVGAMILTVMSVIILITFGVYYVLTGRRIRLTYLASGALMFGIWKMLGSSEDYPLRQLFLGNLRFVDTLSNIIEAYMVIPFLYYFDILQKNRYYYTYRMAQGIAFVSATAGVILDLTGIYYLSQYAIFTFIVITGCIFTILINMLMDILTGHGEDYISISIGVVPFSVTIIGDVVSGLIPKYNSLYGGVVFGLLIFVAVETFSTVIILARARGEVIGAMKAADEGGRFLSEMSHEIRTPVNTILGMNEMIRRETTNEKTAEYSWNINMAGKTLISLIDDIIDFTGFKTGEVNLSEKPYQTASLFNDIFILLEERAVEKRLAFNMNPSGDLPAELTGDAPRIRQILINIVSNAIKYTSEGSVDVEAHGEMEKDRFILCFSVRDTGIGIHEEDMDKLFERYQRFDYEKNKGIEGTGLGLPITKGLVELMGGSLKVESKYGKGSVFYVRIPQKIADPKPMGELKRLKAADVKKSKAYVFRAPGVKVLAVDDNTMNLRVFKGLLKKSEMEIDLAEGGKQALEMLSEKKYDLIFMDHMMPEMDGIETLKALKKMRSNPNRDIPVIVLTANVVSGAEAMYLQEGFSAYLAKPIVPERLVKLLKDFIPEDRVME